MPNEPATSRMVGPVATRSSARRRKSAGYGPRHTVAPFGVPSSASLSRTKSGKPGQDQGVWESGRSSKPAVNIASSLVSIAVSFRVMPRNYTGIIEASAMSRETPVSDRPRERSSVGDAYDNALTESFFGPCRRTCSTQPSMTRNELTQRCTGLRSVSSRRAGPRHQVTRAAAQHNEDCRHGYVGASPRHRQRHCGTPTIHDSCAQASPPPATLYSAGRRLLFVRTPNA